MTGIDPRLTKYHASPVGLSKVCLPTLHSNHQDTEYDSVVFG